MWLVYAAISAVFAALTSILIKLGVDEVSSGLATAVRTTVVLVIAWSIAFATGQWRQAISAKSMVFLCVSGITTGISWIAYNKAIKVGQVSRVAAVDKFSIVITAILAFFILKESVSPKEMTGIAFITAGTLFLVF